MNMASVRPETGTALREALYTGSIFKLAPNNASLELLEVVSELVRAELGSEPRGAAARLGEAAHFACVGRIRKALYLEPVYQQAALRLLESIGQAADQVAFDGLRLRCILDAGHQNPRAKAVYYAHRDTWYAHPQTLITVWVPLDDLAPEETFVFYPECFARAVPNDSQIFDYDEWVEQGLGLKIGWQSRNAGIEARYPGVVGEVDGGEALGFGCVRGEILLFSGAHFHRTLPQNLGRTRFSLDFRFVYLCDHEKGMGAPNVDNRSRGSALRDYVRGVERRQADG